MELVYVGVLLCALAFALVVIYASLVLNRVASTMQTLGTTLNDMEKKMQQLTPELQNTVKETKKIVDDFEDKISATDGFFDALHNIGISVNSSNRILNQQAKKLPEYTSKQSLDRLSEGIKWGDAGYQLYKKWKNRNNHEIVVRDENLPTKK
ncbi:DUF948 domain-containing protein [Virgibacillus kekensis]|uniref:DUF948 domain-containing protein n=1 Tax=Virgibacillus kekensis TaxID=202261 RepID=A0ABV9DMM1_9BACI